MRLPDLPAEGGCRCGALRFRVTEAPILTMACHCRGCQRMTASAYSVSAAIPDPGFQILSGDPAPCGIDPAFGHRSCPTCASWVYTRHPTMEGLTNLRATLLDDPRWLAPFVETFTSTRLGFAQTGAPRSYAEAPSMEDYGALTADFAAWAERA